MHAVADRLSSVRSLFDPAPGLTFLDAATYGLPPRPTVDALERALQRWRAGTADWVEEWDREGDVCRALFATLIGGAADEIALLPTVSIGVGLVAASLPAGTKALVPEHEFESVFFPLLAAEQGRGVTVRQAPFDELAEEIRPETGLVAFSLTRSQDGKSARLADIVEAAARHDARVLVDATHAIPFVPARPHLDRIDYLVCHGYKHLLCPRGVAFLRARRDRWQTLTPYFANWRSGAPRSAHSFDGSARLDPTAAQFDVSLAWHAWAGARPSLELLVEWQRDGALEEVWTLSRRLAAGLGLAAPTSSIVAARAADAEAAVTALAAAGIKCAARGGNIRLSPHVYNTIGDIDRAIAAVGPLMA
ncbi:MAG TPA: aminotransferase class V-fold PLP-dependent enzyme [Thermomicrobiales bacterium]|nr:aminotransferase class V-fold PLP-dependent enzyme [Thermomicrobiales bacterium]